MANQAVIPTMPAVHTKLSRQQITGFWGAWTGWTLDGMDSVIYALVLSPALTELLPKSGYKATPATVGFTGSILFALFLVGWGLSLIWGPIADKLRPHPRAGCHHLCLRDLHRSRSVVTNGVATRIVPFARRYRNRRRVGARRHLCRRSLARKPPQDGRGIFADRLLRRLFSGFRSQLYGRTALRMARHVLVWTHTRQSSPSSFCSA